MKYVCIDAKMYEHEEDPVKRFVNQNLLVCIVIIISVCYVCNDGFGKKI